MFEKGNVIKGINMILRNLSFFSQTDDDDGGGCGGGGLLIFDCQASSKQQIP